MDLWDSERGMLVGGMMNAWSYQISVLTSTSGFSLYSVAIIFMPNSFDPAVYFLCSHVQGMEGFKLGITPITTRREDMLCKCNKEAINPEGSVLGVSGEVILYIVCCNMNNSSGTQVWLFRCFICEHRRLYSFFSLSGRTTVATWLYRQIPL
jgi:hypothetical protein